MSIATENPKTSKPINKATRVAASLSTEMERFADQANSLGEYYEAAFALIAKSAHAKWGEVNFEKGGQMISRTYQADETLNPQVLLELTTTLAVESQVVNRPKSRLIKTADKTFCLSTCPFVDEQGQSEGSATLFAQITSDNVLVEFENFMVACVKVMRMCRKSAQPTPPTQNQPQFAQQDAQLTALAKASKFTDAQELCFALTNNFCRKFDCQRTAMGLVQKQHIKLQSISGMDSFAKNSPVVVDIRQAMEECYDHENRIVVQHGNLDAVPSDHFFLNKRLHDQTGGSAVCSLPIRSQGEIIGVLNLQRDHSKPFTQNEVDSLESSLDAYAPALEMLRKVSMPISHQVKESIREKAQSTVFGSSLKRKIALLTLAAAALYFFVGYIPFSPKIPCTVQSQTAQQISAPFDGVIQSAPFGAGDQVTAGQVILSFDTKDLKYKSQSLAAKIKSFKVVRGNALQAGKTSEAAIAAAEIDVLTAELAGVKRQISNASVVAPFDGTIIRGDLRQQIGQPVAVGAPLFEIAGNDQMRIELAIPESTASYIQPGHDCKFVLASHPGSQLACKIERITPSTTSVDGRNVVTAQAIIETDQPWLQSGMEGVAKVKTGWQPVWWVTTRSVLDQLRLGFWL